MNIRGHGSAVAVVLSVLAVVVAGGGTAIAVSSSVNIADPTSPGRVAKVDQSGRLSVGGAVSNINSAGYLTGFQDSATTEVTSPTTATLAITRIQLSNPSGNTAAAEQQVSLSKYPVDDTGACSVATAPTLVARYNLAAGDDVDDVLASPVVVKPTGTTPYCLFWFTVYLGEAGATPVYYLVYGVSAYATSGTYTGIGTATASAKQPRSAKVSAG